VATRISGPVGLIIAADTIGAGCDANIDLAINAVAAATSSAPNNKANLLASMMQNPLHIAERAIERDIQWVITQNG
jgi:hypothetical protein